MKHEMICLLDLGGKQAYYTARRLRGERFYCELMPATASVEEVMARSPKGILLCGGEAELTKDTKLPFDAAAFGVPVLALGSAARLLARSICEQYVPNNGKPVRSYLRFENCPLFSELSGSERLINEPDSFILPEGYKAVALTADDKAAGFADIEKNIYGLLFDIESNDPDGLDILAAFAGELCHCKQDWMVENFLPELIEDIRAEVGNAHVLLPVSGGLNSSVAAALLNRAIGNRLTCVFIDSGLMRRGDTEVIRYSLSGKMGIKFVCADAHEDFLLALKGVHDSEEKRRILFKEFSSHLVEEYIRLGDIEFIAQSRSYADILNRKPALASEMLDGCREIEPVSRLMKEDIRALSRVLELPEELTIRPAFASAGLAVRCMGEVTAEKLELLRDSDAIFREEVENAGLSRKIAQYFTVLTDIKTPGRNGMGYMCVLRALGSSSAGRAPAYKLPYDLMETVVARITTELPQINHVVYDITGRPIAKVEWE